MLSRRFVMFDGRTITGDLETFDDDNKDYVDCHRNGAVERIAKHDIAMDILDYGGRGNILKNSRSVTKEADGMSNKNGIQYDKRAGN